MRRTLIKFRSLVHIYVNRRRYLKVRWRLVHHGGVLDTPSHPPKHSVVGLEGKQQHPQTTSSPRPHPHHCLNALWGMGYASLG